ncbi:ankyrin repeat domain-containing protein [Aspergillus mulundensis]|uniref:Uncharacterized protein n=1 Tax=Aspergillus mulundensis TaxID=1810919 RepID=A0A3D8R0E3_9EURO|nr:hypothetical protein DSM5745_09256 [Aspergillus mulundensis]RDW67390.1 hypothetical protein DSM5745_09256 [Aspergillus mulundensis]
MPSFRLFNLPNELIVAILKASEKPDLAAFIRTSHLSWDIGHPILYALTLEEKKQVFLWAARHNQPGLVQYIINDLVPVLKKDAEYRRNAFRLASTSGCIQIVGIALDHGADPDLAKAIGADQLEVVQLLLSRGARVVNGRNPLHFAASYGAKKVVEYLLSPNIAGVFDVDSHDDQYNTPLLKAARYGHTDVIKVLLAHKAGPNFINEVDETALLAASKGGHGAAVKALLDGGANVNGVPVISVLVDLSEQADTNPLLATFYELLEKKAFGTLDVRPDMETQLPAGYRATIRALLDRGADITKVNYFTGLSALDYATILGDPEVLRWILAHPPAKCHLNREGKHGLAPLSYATTNGAVCKLLLDAGASVAVDKNLALILAAKYRGKGAAEVLIARRPQHIDCTNSIGQTALAMAAMEGNKEIAQMLIKAGADLNKPDCIGQTPLGHAVANEYDDEVASLLRQAGARPGKPSGEYPEDRLHLWEDIVEAMRQLDEP